MLGGGGLIGGGGDYLATLRILELGIVIKMSIGYLDPLQPKS